MDLQSQQTSKTLNVLIISSSSRNRDSVTRDLTEELVQELRHQYGEIKVTERDVAASPLPTISEAWIEANFTKPEDRSASHRTALEQSDALVEELSAADVIILGVPIYNFSVPASLKAWIDLVARAGLTFRYTESGPVGLLEGKQAFVVVASGGVPIGGAMDFASPYIRHVLGFIGINQVEVIAAERLNVDSDASKQQAQRQIVQAVSKYSLNDKSVNAA